MRGTSAEAQGHRLGAWPVGLSAPHLGLACSCLWRNHSLLLGRAGGRGQDCASVENLCIFCFSGVKLQPLNLANCFEKAGLRFKTS